MIEKVKEIIDKYPWLLMVVPIIIVAILGFFFLSGRNNASSTNPSSTSVSKTGTASNSQPSNASNATTTQNSGFNIFSFLLRLLDSKSSSTQNTTSASNPISNTNSSQSGSSTNNSATTNGSNNSSTSVAGNQQNNSGNTQTSQSSSGSTPTTPIQIIFKIPGGGTEVYTPPPTPPVDITWARYVNAADRYAVDYPSNWQLVKTEYNGHEGISLYMPGMDPSDPNVQYIGFGLASYYLLPAGASLQNTYTYPVTISGINGTMYTQGILGTGSVALVAQTSQGYFGMGSNISDPDFIYVYNYMLQSLTFGPQ